MLRLLSALVIATGLMSTPAVTAPMQSFFEASSSSTISLRSATFVGTTTDASSSIEVFPAGFPSDDGVEFPFGDTEASIGGFETAISFGNSSFVRGRGSLDPFDPSEAFAVSFSDRNFFYGDPFEIPSGPDIELVFDFSLVNTATSSGGATTELLTSVLFGVTDSFFDPVFTEVVDLTPVGDLSGSVSFTISPGFGVSASSFTSAQGEAPTVVPAPAGLPLVVTGLAFLGFLGHRRKVMARQPCAD